MRHIKKLCCLAFLCIGFGTTQALSAQVKVQVNLGVQPIWGPAGYDRADYYFMPDIDTYYDINRREFIYNSGNDWVRAASLPPRYRNYDLYNGYKVVVNDRNPYLHDNDYRRKYANQARQRQTLIRDSRDEKYYQIKEHPMHDQWQRTHGGDNNGGDRGNRNDRNDRNNKNDRNGHNDNHRNDQR